MALKIVTTNTISYSAIGIGISHDIIQFVFLKPRLVLQDVFLRDIWPTRDEIQAVEKKYVIPAMFKVG